MYVCMYVCMYDPNEGPPHPPGFWLFHIRKHIPTATILFWYIRMHPCNYKVVQSSHKAVKGCPSLFTVSIPRLQQPSDNKPYRPCDNLVSKLVTTKNNHIFSIWDNIHTHIINFLKYVAQSLLNQNILYNHSSIFFLNILIHTYYTHLHY